MEKSLSDQKSLLRARHQVARKGISNDTRLAWDRAVESRILALPQVRNARRVFVYLSRKGEVSTQALVQAFLKDHKIVLTPSPDIRALPHDGLFKVCANTDTADPGAPVLCGESRVSDIDLVLVPGIVWDQDGYRIGFGGGYFDRLLEMVRPDCFNIGLAYDIQMEESVPRESWDRKVDMVVTPTRIYEGGGKY